MRIATLLTRHKPRRPPTTANLDNVRVASPCPVNWAAMPGDDRVRHCHECELNVYNLSEMTRAEAEQLIASQEGRLCVRFYRRGDGTILTKDCPRGLRAIAVRVSRMAGTFLSAIIAMTPAFAQSPPGSSTQGHASSASSDKNSQLGLDVTVLDPSSAVIQNAKVVLCRCNGKITNNTATDSSGTAHFTGLVKGTYEIRIEAQGFKKVERSVTIKNREQLQVKLQIATQSTTVEVKAESPVVMGTVVGILAVTHSSGFPVVAPAAGRPGLLR